MNFCRNFHRNHLLQICLLMLPVFFFVLVDIPAFAGWSHIQGTNTIFLEKSGAALEGIYTGGSVSTDGTDAVLGWNCETLCGEKEATVGVWLFNIKDTPYGVDSEDVLRLNVSIWAENESLFNWTLDDLIGIYAFDVKGKATS